MTRFRNIIIPNWLRVSAIAMLAVVTVLLVVSQIAPSFSRPSPVGIDRILQLEDQEVTLNLSLEFGYDPMIVQITRKLATKAMLEHKCACPTWRFVRTDYDLSYLLLSIVQTESRGDYKAFNPAGKAYGLTQLLMSTARQYDKTVTEQELLTIPKNLDIAMTHFVSLLETYHGNSTLAVIAWNRGQGSIDRLIALGNSPENGYARVLFNQAAMRNSLQRSDIIR